MSKFEPKDLSFALFPNTRKRNDKDPNLTGTARIGGVDYWASAWTNTKEDGTKWIKGNLNLKQAHASNGQASPPADGPEDDIPF